MKLQKIKEISINIPRLSHKDILSSYYKFVSLRVGSSVPQLALRSF